MQPSGRHAHRRGQQQVIVEMEKRRGHTGRREALPMAKGEKKSSMGAEVRSAHRMSKYWRPLALLTLQAVVTQALGCPIGVSSKVSVGDEGPANDRERVRIPCPWKSRGPERCLSKVDAMVGKTMVIKSCYLD